jgi:hypothetical protein
MNTYEDESGRVYEDRPVARQPRAYTCRNCPAGRVVISDGHGGWVHEDDYKYSCDPRDRKSVKVATPR